MTDDSLRIDVHLGPDDLPQALRADVQRGLTAAPKWLPPKWFYDDRGSELFEQITELEEYYPTRREREILAARAVEIAGAAKADTLVELGAGTSRKTRMLLDAFAEIDSLRRFVPFDISEGTLRATAADVLAEYPGCAVHAIVGDFEHHLEYLPRDGTRMIAFLGGTIGNLVPSERARFLGDVAGAMNPGDSFLLGTDLVKDPDRLVAAYDDAKGVTAAFNRNVLHVLNRELQADLDPDAFDHVARWDAEREWIEMRLRSSRAQTANVRALDLTVSFDADEEMRTEVSAKFRRDGIAAELARAGLRLAHWWTDESGDFALSLSYRDD